MAFENVIVSGATVLYSATGTALPNINTVPFDSYGSWTGWATLGITTGPTRIRHEKEYYTLDAQQYSYPVLSRLVGKRTSVGFEIADLGSTTFALLMDGTAATVSPGAGVKGSYSVEFGSNLVTTEKQFAIEGFRVDSSNNLQPARWFFYRAVLALEGDFDFNKRDSVRARCRIFCLADISKVSGVDVGKIQYVTAPAS